MDMPVFQAKLSTCSLYFVLLIHGVGSFFTCFLEGIEFGDANIKDTFIQNMMCNSYSCAYYAFLF